MSERRLFRTPGAIGLLSGGLAGAVGLVSTVLEAHLQSAVDGFHLLWNLTALATLLLQFVLPALLIKQNARMIVGLLLRIGAFFFLAFASPLMLLVDGWGFLADHIQIYWVIWNVLYSIAFGLFLGFALARIYRREKLLKPALGWGVLGSVVNIALQLVLGYLYIYLEDTSENWWAGIAMATAVAQVVQGAVAAVPFERAARQELASSVSSSRPASD